MSQVNLSYFTTSC